MREIAVYNTEFLAREAVDYLLANGIRAVAAPKLFGAYNNQWGACVMIDDESQRERAVQLLDELDATPLTLDGDWEDAARPDLSKLPAGMCVPCPACGANVVVRPDGTRCYACGSDIDVVEAMVAAFGPEVLEVCYAEEGLDIPAEVVQNAALKCSKCDYNLQGLAEAGLCPECGRPYSKRAMLRRTS